MVRRLRREVTKLKAERDILKRPQPSSRGSDVKFAFIAKHRSIWPVAWQCEALGVSRSGFHAWLIRCRSTRALIDEALLARIRASFASSARTYGARRVWRDADLGSPICGRGAPVKSQQFGVALTFSKGQRGR